MDIAENIILSTDCGVNRVIGVTSDERYIVYAVGRDIICRDLVNNKIIWRKAPPDWLEHIPSYPHDPTCTDFHIYKDKEEWFIAIEYLDSLIRKSMVTGMEEFHRLDFDMTILRIYSNVSSLIKQQCDIYLYCHETDRKIWEYSNDRWTNIDILHNQYLAVIGDFGLTMIDIQYGIVRWNNKEVEQYSGITLSPDGNTIVTYIENDIWLIDYKDGHLIRKIYLRGYGITDIQYSSDGELLFINREDESVIMNISGKMIWEGTGLFEYDYDCRYNKQKIWIDENNMKYIMNANARDIDKWGVEMKRVYYDTTTLCDMNFTDLGTIVYRDNLGILQDCDYVQGNRNLYLCRNPFENWTAQTHHLSFQSKKRMIETLFTIRNITFPDVPNEVLYIICGLLYTEM